MRVVGGFVAWFADNLGRTLGKKRLTLFHMRPRHTATLLTVTAGTLIPLVTVLALAIASRDYREWLVEGHEAIQRRNILIKEVDSLTDQEHRLTTLNEGLKLQAVEKQKELDTKKRQVAQLTKLAQDEQQKAKLLAGKLNTLQASILTVQRDLRSTTQSLVSTERARDEIQKKYQAAQKDYKIASASFYELRRQTNELNMQNIQLTSQNDKLTKDVSKLSDSAKDLTQKNQKAQMDLDNTRYQLETAKLSLDRMQVDLAYMQDQIGAYQKFLKKDLDTSRYQPLIFNMGQELARVAIPARASAEEAKGYYQQLWLKAVAVANGQGAMPLPGSGSPDPVGFFQRTGEKMNQIDPKEQERLILKGITGAKDDLILVASCFANTFKGEWVPLDVKSFRNPLVYRRNDTVAEGRINGGLSEGAILQQISDFMRKTVRPKALQDRMIPIFGEEEGLGEVTADQTYRLVKQIREADRPIRLVVKADADTRAGDPLQLTFLVR
jgi:uncharacterized protein (DUF3084 family)